MTPIKIGFVLLSNSEQAAPSTRIAVLNMFPFLRAAGFDPAIVFEPAPGRDSKKPDVVGVARKVREAGIRVVLFQKVRGPAVLALARELRGLGVKTVYQVCDLVDPEMAAVTDVTTTTTEYLRTLYPSELRQRIHVVHDGIEHPEHVKTAWSGRRGSPWRPLRAVLVTSLGLTDLPVLGNPPDWLRVTVVGKYSPGGMSLSRLREIRWHLSGLKNRAEKTAYLRFLANRRVRCVGWDPLGVYDYMKAADIGIIPVDTAPDLDPELDQPSFWQVKSENRLTMKMCVGLPVIATPIPSYEPVVEQGRNAFLAESYSDWMACLELLRDPDARHEMGQKARASVLRRYSMEEQASRLLAVLRGLLD